MQTTQKTIVLAIFTLQGNGAERFVLTLAQGLMKARHHVHVVIFKDKIELPLPTGLQVHHFAYQRYRILPKGVRSKIASRAFDRFIKARIGTPDLVLSNLYPVDFVLCHSQLNNVYFVIHNTMSAEYANCDKKTHQHLSTIYQQKPCIGVSLGVSEDFLAFFADSRQRITTIYNPIDSATIAREACAFVPEFSGYLIHVGKFKAQKNHRLLLEAYAKSKQSKPLLLLGTGALQSDCEALAYTLGIADKVHFLGFCPNPYPYIKHADGMILSSDFEGLGLVILESLALGTPVISTDCPSGPSEILPTNNLVPTHNSLALAQKIDALCQTPSDFLAPIKPVFTLDYATDAYLQLVSQPTP